METQEILYTALDNIPNEIGANIRWEKNMFTETEGKLWLTINNEKIGFYTEIKKELREHQLPILETAAQKKQPFILVAHYLRPKIKTELRKRNIGYLEKNGNIFINNKNWFILIDANKPIDVAKETGNRAFTKTGLKVVYLYLTEEKWLNEPQRKIAKKTGLSELTLEEINSEIKAVRDAQSYS
jgi:hypothetical protein